MLADSTTAVAKSSLTGNVWSKKTERPRHYVEGPTKNLP